MAANGPEKRSADAEVLHNSVKRSRCEHGDRSCLPQLPSDLAAHTAIWDDVCLMARTLAEATPDNDCLRKSEVLSEEEFYRQRLTRVTDILQTYETELANLEEMLALKKTELRKQVHTQGLPHARLWGHAYPGWIVSEGPGLGPSDKGEPGGCTGTWGPNQEPCGMACMPLSTFCHECILNDPLQTLYTKDPDRGRPVMRNPSAAQISKLHQSEQLKAEELNKDADVLSLETSGLAGTQPAYSKISTPDRHIAAGLLAACMAPFPHAAKHKERRESSSISKESAATNTGGGCSATAATKEANAGSGSAATAAATVVSSQAANVPQAPVGAPSSTMQLHMPVIGAGMQFHMTPHGALPVQGMHPAQFFALMGHAFPAAMQMQQQIQGMQAGMVVNWGDPNLAALMAAQGIAASQAAAAAAAVATAAANNNAAAAAAAAAAANAPGAAPPAPALSAAPQAAPSANTQPASQLKDTATTSIFSAQGAPGSVTAVPLAPPPPPAPPPPVLGGTVGSVSAAAELVAGSGGGGASAIAAGSGGTAVAAAVGVAVTKRGEFELGESGVITGANQQQLLNTDAAGASTSAAKPP